MLDLICAEIRNYFVKSVHRGTFEIKDSSVDLSQILAPGQYFRIIGSVFNDGVYQYPCRGLTDESFTGEVWAMAIPPALIALADEIKKYEESDAAKPSPYTSESFGGYSYTKATGSGGVPIGWRKVFGSQLNRWRKI